MPEKSDNLEFIGSQVRFWREMRRFAVKDLADAVGMDPSDLSKVERGKAGMSLARLARMANELGVSVSVLIDHTLFVVPVNGRITGEWVSLPGPLFADLDIYPLVMNGIRPACCAFEVGTDKSHWLICGAPHLSPIENMIYVTLLHSGNKPRKGSKSLLGLGESKLSIRVFRKEMEDSDLLREYNIMRTKGASLLGSLSKFEEGRGWFIASEDDGLGKYIHRDDPLIIRNWPIIGTFEFFTERFMPNEEFFLRSGGMRPRADDVRGASPTTKEQADD